MRHVPIDNQLFVHNRKSFVKHMEPNSIAIFHSNYQYVLNGDAVHTFRQNSDLFWLTGVGQENTVLFLFPDCPVPEYREVLFITETNEHIATWEGYKLTKEHACEISGVENIHWNNDLLKKCRSIINMAEHIYLPLNENDRFSANSPYKAIDVVKEIQDMFPLHQYKRAGHILQRLRAIKHPIEIELHKKAIAISKLGFERVLKFTQPGKWEFDIEAELIHEYTRNRAFGFSFEPIIASGSSAVTLHYIDNDKQIKDGDLILLDNGVNYANFASDMTRCIPANGKFSSRQKEIYEAVLNVMNFAKSILQPGKLLMDYHKEVQFEMQNQLLEIGLISQSDLDNQTEELSATRKYFMHGSSHFLGIDVHDSGMRYEPLQENMLLTVEPGIYIKEEGIGVRIENNILLKKEGNIDLMDEINMPISVDQIEERMR